MTRWKRHRSGREARRRGHAGCGRSGRSSRRCVRARMRLAISSAAQSPTCRASSRTSAADLGMSAVWRTRRVSAQGRGQALGVTCSRREPRPAGRRPPARGVAGPHLARPPPWSRPRPTSTMPGGDRGGCRDGAPLPPGQRNHALPATGRGAIRVTCGRQPPDLRAPLADLGRQLGQRVGRPLGADQPAGRVRVGPPRVPDRATPAIGTSRPRRATADRSRRVGVGAMRAARCSWARVAMFRAVDVDIARATGAAASTARAWLGGTRPRPASAPSAWSNCRRWSSGSPGSWIRLHRRLAAQARSRARRRQAAQGHRPR